MLRQDTGEPTRCQDPILGRIVLASLSDHQEPSRHIGQLASRGSSAAASSETRGVTYGEAHRAHSGEWENRVAALTLAESVEEGIRTAFVPRLPPDFSEIRDTFLHTLSVQI